MESSILDLVSSFLGDGSSEAITTTVDQGRSASPIHSSCEDQGAEVDKAVKVVIFSKDRPWQLQQLLRSFQLPTSTSRATKHSVSVQLLVLACVRGEYREGYDRVCSEFTTFIDSNSHVEWTFLDEDRSDPDSFASLLRGLLTDTGPSSANYWLFLTDDCLLLVPLFELLDTAIYALSSRPEVLCFISRLHPGISWVQTRDKPSLPPRRHMRYQPAPPACSSKGTYTYPLARGTLDWAYPWDLSGGLYRHEFVQVLLRHLEGTDCLSHPNRLELGGNQAFASRPSPLAAYLGPHEPWIAIATQPMLVILAINRVQDVCQAPLACDEPGTMSPEALGQLLEDNRDIDLEHYQTEYYNSSHIGDLILVPASTETKCEERIVSNMTEPFLSVLVPVRTGPPDEAFHAMVSVAIQPIEHHDAIQQKVLQGPTFRLSRPENDANPLSPLQIVIVDDGCVDGSIDAMIDAVKSVAEDNREVAFYVRDHRTPNLHCKEKREEPAEDCKKSLDGVVQLFIDIHESPKEGIAAALNHGLLHCRADFVARMDADDVVAPGRFINQLKLLQRRADLAVAGTDMVIFRESTSSGATEEYEGESASCGAAYTGSASLKSLPYSPCLPSSRYPQHRMTRFDTRVSLPPSDPFFAAWAMLFSCCMSHPSTMYKKKAIQRIGGYDEKYTAAEDYELWLRLTKRSPSSLVSLPHLGVWHRKHPGNQSKVRKQNEETLRALRNTLPHSLEEAELHPEAVESFAALRKPERAQTRDAIDEAAGLLLSMEKTFMEDNAETITRREMELIREDRDARLGELATLSLTRFGISDVMKSRAWNIWCEVRPDLTLQRIALFLDEKKKDNGA